MVFQRPPPSAQIPRIPRNLAAKKKNPAPSAFLDLFQRLPLRCQPVGWPVFASLRLENRQEKLPMIGKIPEKVSNDWKTHPENFQWLEKCQEKFPMVGKSSGSFQ